MKSRIITTTPHPFPEFFSIHGWLVPGFPNNYRLTLNSLPGPNYSVSPLPVSTLQFLRGEIDWKSKFLNKLTGCFWKCLPDQMLPWRRSIPPYAVLVTNTPGLCSGPSFVSPKKPFWGDFWPFFLSELIFFKVSRKWSKFKGNVRRPKRNPWNALSNGIFFFHFATTPQLA